MKIFLTFLSIYTSLGIHFAYSYEAKRQLVEQNERVQIRSFRKGEEQNLYQLFYETVHSVNSKDYNQEQIEVWAPKSFDKQKWELRFGRNITLVAEKGKAKNVVGFTVLGKADYHESMLYVHKDFLHQGVGPALVKAREQKALELGMKEVMFDVSITAFPFFKKYGYSLDGEQVKVISGVEFKVYVMKKLLSGIKDGSL